MVKIMKKVILVVVVALIVLFIVMVSKDLKKNPIEKQPEQSEESVDVVFDATKYSRMPVDDLTAELGDPKSISKLDEMDVYDYQVDGVYLTFIIADGSVVKMYYMPDNAINLPNDEMTIFKMFNIEPKDNIKQTVDTGTTWKYSPVSDKVAEVELYDVSEDSFGYAYFTYNLNYFN